MNSHKVKSKTINIILFCPVIYRFYHKFPVHSTGASCGIPTARLIIVCHISVNFIIVIRHNLIKIRICRVICMIVHHVHNNFNSSIVECLNHFLRFSNSYITIVWVTGIRTFRYIKILRIISPVIITSQRISYPCFIYRCIIIHRHKLHMGHTKFL